MHGMMGNRILYRVHHACHIRGGVSWAKFFFMYLCHEWWCAVCDS